MKTIRTTPKIIFRHVLALTDVLSSLTGRISQFQKISKIPYVDGHAVQKKSDKNFFTQKLVKRFWNRVLNDVSEQFSGGGNFFQNPHVKEYLKMLFVAIGLSQTVI